MIRDNYYSYLKEKEESRKKEREKRINEGLYAIGCLVRRADGRSKEDRIMDCVRILEEIVDG